MTKDEALAMDLALEALEGVVKNCWRDIPSWRLDEIKERITAIKQARSAPYVALPRVQSCYCPNCEAMGKELAALKAQLAPVQEPVADAMARYLRVCSSGRMPKKLQESVQNLVYDAERLGYFKAITPPAAQITYTKKDVDSVRDHLMAINTCIAAQDVIGAQAMVVDVLKMLEDFNVTMQKDQNPAAFVRDDGSWDGTVLELVWDKKDDGFIYKPLYTTPPGGRQSEDCLTAAQRQWVKLTDKERNKIRFDHLDYDERAQAIEAKLMEKNT